MIIHILAEVICRDRLVIVDQSNLIYSNCTELAKPMQIVSDSNELQVIISKINSVNIIIVVR